MGRMRCLHDALVRCVRRGKHSTPGQILGDDLAEAVVVRSMWTNTPAPRRAQRQRCTHCAMVAERRSPVDRPPPPPPLTVTEVVMSSMAVGCTSTYTRSVRENPRSNCVVAQAPKSEIPLYQLYEARKAVIEERPHVVFREKTRSLSNHAALVTGQQVPVAEHKFEAFPFKVPLRDPDEEASLRNKRKRRLDADCGDVEAIRR